MNKTFINVLLLIGSGIILKKLFSNKKLIVKGSYSVPENIPNRLDALHSFERRASDKFGGGMSTKINSALRSLYKKGINPDLTDLQIKIDPVKYSVQWTATIEPSKNGKAYVGMITRGSAGANADSRAKAQIQNINKEINNGKNIELVKDLNFNDRFKIRQFFYKYGLTSYPDL